MEINELVNVIGEDVFLRDYDGMCGKPIAMETDGETVIVHIVDENFSRWSDLLDLTIAPQ